MNSQPLSRIFAIATIVLAFSTLALAGPPLICHPIEIGPAHSLPWVDLNYQKGNDGYDLKNLTRDTLAVLDANPSVLVRMETLRRATIYARQDSQVAKELLVRLHARATDSNDALTSFDVGYLAEAYKQWMGRGEPNPANSLDGYGLIQKAIALRGSDPEMEFAAALVTLSGPQHDHDAHVQKAMAGAKTDALLAQNLASSFRQQSISALLTSGKPE